MVRVPKKYANQKKFQEDLKKRYKKAAGNTKGSKFDAKVTRKVTAKHNEYFSSKPTEAFRDELTKELDKTRKELLNVQVQGFILSPLAIFDDIKDKRSPFMWKNSSGTGEIFSPLELRAAAKEISSQFFQIIKDNPPTSTKSIDVDGLSPKNIILAIKKAARNFKGGKAIAFDNSKKIVYYYNVKATADKFRNFTENYLTKRIIPKILSTFPKSSYIVTYLKPDEEWIRIKDQLRQESIDAGETERQKTERFAAGLKNYQIRTGKSGYEGTQFGHTFGAAATKAAIFLENPDDLSHTYKGRSSLRIRSEFSDVGARVISGLVNAVLTSDTRIFFEKRYSSKEVHGELTLFMNENAASNLSTGSETSSRIRALRNIVRSITNVIATWGASPSFNQMILDIIEGAFYGTKIPSQTYKTKTSIKTKEKAQIQYAKPKGFKGQVEYSEPKTGKSQTNTDLSQLLSFLNSKMHDKIRENMGKGGSKQVLNYRTGRFAKSVKLQSLYNINEKRALGAQVKYMKYPYGVFEPGGRLHKPGRDPHRIIGRSIRQILQEEKIANLRRVKVRLNG